MPNGGWLASGRVFKFTKDNVSRLPNTAGNYSFYNGKRKKVYVGTTKGNVGAKWGTKPHQRYRYGIKHRVQSYMQVDDHKEHPTKPALRKEIKYFSYTPIRSHNKRRSLEKKTKKKLKHNHW